MWIKYLKLLFSAKKNNIIKQLVQNNTQYLYILIVVYIIIYIILWLVGNTLLLDNLINMCLLRSANNSLNIHIGL